MGKELELWRFIYGRLLLGQRVLLLIVAESSGSSPGRAGYKMAVAGDGEILGSIGGGVMEVNLVEQSRKLLIGPHASLNASPRPIEQVHQKYSLDASGMICSGRQTVVLKLLTPENTGAVNEIIGGIGADHRNNLIITPEDFRLEPSNSETPNFRFEKRNDGDFIYEERVGSKEDLYIIGGGHCAFALSELMSKLDFRMTIFDDRPELSTLQKNEFAEDISIIDSYEKIGDRISNLEDKYVVVMTLGYASDKVVIKSLCGRDFKYFGVLGSKAKMATLLKELKDEGIPDDQLTRIRTPIGLPINSRTPEEIAVSIAAEIIAVRNTIRNRNLGPLD